MINVKDVYKLQAEYGVADGSFKDAETSFESYMSACRLFVQENYPADYDKLDAERKLETLVNLAALFVEKHRINVKGYMTAEGMLDNDLLLTDITDALTGVAVIREALEDPEIDEIQINDKNTIYVIRNGVAEYYHDKGGRVMSFSNTQEIYTLLNKLIDDGTGNIPQFTDGNPLLNAKTAKHQYRINAVHEVANTRQKPPFNDPIVTVVLRKFKETHLEIDDLVRGNTCTEQMGRLLTKLGRAELKLFCVGPTGSGKTTLLRIIASTVPEDKRMILIQNPTEISFFDLDEYGRNKRNVVHWEVVQGADGLANNTATMANLISNALRSTPEVILVGEAREPEEFEQILRGARTGHKMLGTFHAEDAEDGVGRFAGELPGNYMENIRIVCKSLDVIISQHRFENGERKIMEITEILGVNEYGDPNIRKIFEFKFNGKMEHYKDKYGKDRTRVLGDFKRLHSISEKLQNALFKVGIPLEDISEFCEPGELDIEEFTKVS